MMRHRISVALGLGLAVVLAVGTQAQDEKKAGGQAPSQFKSREDVNAYFYQKTQELERQYVAALAGVAEREEGEAANATYRLLFNLAIAKNEYPAAEKAAERVMEKNGFSPDVEMLAHFVNVIAEADRGAYDESMKSLQDYLKGNQENRRRIDPDTALAIGEAYFQRLVQAGRYDNARQLVELAASSPHAAVREHFAKRARRLERLGKPAPELSGTNPDGKPIKLADYRGKVVLVDFWATWCPPCSMQMIRLNTLRDHFKDRDFEVLGVNVDALRHGAGAMDDVLPQVRRYLIDHQASFPNIVCQPGDSDIPNAFGVEDIPANFLIDREGKIVGFELGDGNMVDAIKEALDKK
jgi:peroxiredoxin